MGRKKKRKVRLLKSIIDGLYKRAPDLPPLATSPCGFHSLLYFAVHGTPRGLHGSSAVLWREPGPLDTDAPL
jgi:hypothetical protein